MNSMVEIAIQKAVEQLEAFTKQHANETFYACAYDNGNLSLNTVSAYERMERENSIWDVSSWEMTGVIKDWFNLESLIETNGKSQAFLIRCLLQGVLENKLEIFPNTADYFEVLYVEASTKAIGLENISLLLNPNTALGILYREAINTKNESMALDLIDKIDDANWEVLHVNGFHEMTLLEAAMEIDSEALVRKLIVKGASLENSTQWTHNLKLLNILTEEGARFDLSTQNIVASASEEYYLDKLNCMLDAEGDIDGQTKDGETPLMRAVGNGNTQVVKRLIERCARMEIKNNDGDTIHDIADYEYIKDLLSEYNIK